MLILAERWAVRERRWIAKVRIEAGARCDRCSGEIPAGETAYARSEVGPDEPGDERNARLELVHAKGRCLDPLRSAG